MSLIKCLVLVVTSISVLLLFVLIVVCMHKINNEKQKFVNLMLVPLNPVLYSNRPENKAEYLTWYTMPSRMRGQLDWN